MRPGEEDARRPADPRQHAPRGHLDRDPGDHPRRAVHLRVRRPRRHRGGEGQRDASSTSTGQQFAWTLEYPQADGQAGQVDRQLYLAKGRPGAASTCKALDVIHDFWVPAVPHEDRRRPRHHDELPRHAQPARQLPRRLRRALRPRALRHALDGARRHARQVRRLDGQAEGARAAAGSDGRRRRGKPARQDALHRRQRRSSRPRLRRLPHAGRRRHDRQTGPDLDKVLKGKDAAFIKESIVDPTPRSPQGFHGHHAQELRRYPVAGGAGRSRDVPRQGRREVSDDEEAALDGRQVPRTGLVPGRSLCSCIGVALAYAIIVIFRCLVRPRPARRAARPSSRSALFAVPLGFLVGLGAFDYWFYWASGQPTLPEDHSGHGAHSWQRLLPGQHRPQGHRHPVRRDLVLLPVRRRPDRDAHARRARAAGPPVRRRRARSTASSASTRRC